MTRPVLIRLVLAGMLAAAIRAAAQEPADAPVYPYYGNTPEELVPFRNVEPHHRYWLERLPFHGPGRDYPDPEGLTSLKIGLLSPPPTGKEARRGHLSRCGVVLAIEEANAAREPGTLPFELIERLDSPQWGSAANLAVEFADLGALAFIGTIDGDATHVALRVALKIEMFIVNCSDPDPTLTETQIPWLLRVFPDNRQVGNRLADVVVTERGLRRIVVLRPNSRPGRVGVMPFVQAVKRLGAPVLQEANFREGVHDFAYQVGLIRQANPDAVVFWGNPEDIGPAAAQLRAAGLDAAFFGFDRLMDPEFIRLAGDAAEGATAGAFFDPDKTDPAWTGFVQRFEARFDTKPEAHAAYAYDGTRMLLDAVRQAGPNRFRIRDRMAAFETYDGVTGRMEFDGRWDNVAPVGTATCRQGRWVFSPPPPRDTATADPAPATTP
jgi:ABC-type branched-subunit amino acid transport system substrate-binding protein